MERLTIEEFEASRAAFDAQVETDPQIDRYCSRSEWILPFHRAFRPEQDLCLHRSGSSFVALASNHHPEFGHYLEALECMWGFGCPLVGPQAVALLAEILTRWSDPPLGTPVLLTGIPLTGDLPLQLGRKLHDFYRLRVVDIVTRYVASLEGGIDDYLSRRSPAFRRNLRSARRGVSDAGIRFRRVGRIPASEMPQLYRRILEIERRSWKASTGNGVDRGSMKEFYQDMLPRLAQRDGLRVIIAERGGSDVGYIHGAVVGDHYRGLQFSFDQRLSKLSLGNVLQYEMLQWLCRDGCATYDLGSQSAYKRRWAEEGLATATLLLRPERGETRPRSDPPARRRSGLVGESGS
jgi:hypothetical protein